MALHILLADDSVPAQNMGKKILTDAGFEVTTASNGLEAIRKIADAVPDVAVLDIFMPGYSGLEVCQKLRASTATATLPVVLTVGKLEPYRPEDGARVQSSAVIVKPFIAADLVKIVLEVAAQAGKTGAHEPEPAAPAEPAEADEPIFSYAPTIDRVADFPMGESTAYGAAESEADGSSDSMLFNPDAKHTPFSASATDFIPSISVGETRGATVESVIADINLEPEGKDRDERTLRDEPLSLPPQGLLPEITPPPLDIPTLDPLLDIGTQPIQESILGESTIEVGELPEQHVVRPEPPAEVLTPEEEARRRAFEELFNSTELPPLEEPSAVHATTPADGEIALAAAQPEATKLVAETEFTSWTASAPVSVETPSAPGTPAPALETSLESPEESTPVPAEEAPVTLAAVEEAAPKWEVTPAPAESATTSLLAEALPAWGAAETEDTIAGDFPLDAPPAEAPVTTVQSAAGEAEAEPAALPETSLATAGLAEAEHTALDELHLDQQHVEQAHVEHEAAAEVAAPASETPRAKSWSAAEPAPAEEHHGVLEGWSGAAMGAGFAASIPAAAALVEEQLKNVIAALSPAEAKTVEHVPEPPATAGETAVTETTVSETAATEAAAAEEAAPEAVAPAPAQMEAAALEIAALARSAVEPETVAQELAATEIASPEVAPLEVPAAAPLEVAPVEVSPVEASLVEIAAHEIARPEAETQPAAKAVAGEVPAANAAPEEGVHEEAAHKVALPVEVPAESAVAVSAVAAAATAVEIARVEAPAAAIAEHVAEKADDAAVVSATVAGEEVRSAEAERMHQAVERVFDRFKPLLIAAIVRELARTDTE